MELDDPTLDRLLATRPPRGSGGDPPGDDADEPLDDGLLLAWRAGRLAPEAVEAVEARLARDPEARALAAALATWPPEAVLQRARAALPGQARPVAWLALAAGLLLAAFGAWVFLARDVAPGPAYTAGPLQGGVRTLMAEDAPDTGVFLPTSALRVVLTPATPGAPPPVAVYADRGGPTLTRVAARIDPGEGGVFRVVIGAGEAFGEAFGPRRLVIALGPLDAPATLAWDERPQAGLTWLALPVDYRRSIEETP
ncbi:MAG: hypothetical protein H6706_06540 [Myxococcales bacterium]|nr:hypothetical protein [Myxococcales bacterium]